MCYFPLVKQCPDDYDCACPPHALAAERLPHPAQLARHFPVKCRTDRDDRGIEEDHIRIEGSSDSGFHHSSVGDSNATVNRGPHYVLSTRTASSSTPTPSTSPSWRSSLIPASDRGSLSHADAGPARNTASYIESLLNYCF